jgi:hypothetical protein
MQRLWAPLEKVAVDTKTQFGGCLPPRWAPPHDPHANGTTTSNNSSSSSSSSSSGSGSNKVVTSSSNNGASTTERHAWQFTIFPYDSAASSAGSTGSSARQYVAPPRRITGVVLVGAATRLPCIQHYVRTVSAAARMHMWVGYICWVSGVWVGRMQLPRVGQHRRRGRGR